jgi:RNA polymerase sigma factor (sigma-70 family)
MARAEAEWEALMRQATAGDGAAYRRLLISLTPALRAIVRRNAGRIGLEASEAEDVVQEALLAIHLKRDTWEPDRPIGPWIMTIARNKLIDARRRKGNVSTAPIDDFAETLSAAAGSGSVDNDLDRLDIDRLLARLGDRDRALVRALSIEGHSVRDTAARLNMSEGAVRVALHRAVKRLASFFRGEDL